MKTFDFQEKPPVAPYCLWVSGLLLESGSRASVGLPRLQRVRHTAGNRLAMGDKASGAWGAPDANPLRKLAAGVASLWGGGLGECAENSQMRFGSVSVNGTEFLLWDGVSHLGFQMPDGERVASRGLNLVKISDGADVASGKTSPALGNTEVSAGEDPILKPKVLFRPKPDPWRIPAGPCDGGAEPVCEPSFYR